MYCLEDKKHYNYILNKLYQKSKNYIYDFDYISNGRKHMWIYNPKNENWIHNYILQNCMKEFIYENNYNYGTLSTTYELLKYELADRVGKYIEKNLKAIIREYNKDNNIKRICEDKIYFDILLHKNYFLNEIFRNEFERFLERKNNENI